MAVPTRQGLSKARHSVRRILQSGVSVRGTRRMLGAQGGGGFDAAVLTHPDTRSSWRRAGTQMRMEQISSNEYSLTISVEGETPEDEPEFYNFPLAVTHSPTALELEFSNGQQVFQGKWSPAGDYGANKISWVELTRGEIFETELLCAGGSGQAAGEGGLNVEEALARDPRVELKHVYFFDTTLRDGQQSPGAGMPPEHNIEYAVQANLLGVDILEAGFPASGGVDFQIVHDVASMMRDPAVSNMVVAGLCQLREDQIRKTMEALEPLRGVRRVGDPYNLLRARVHMYVPVGRLADFSIGKKDASGRAQPVTAEQKRDTVKKVAAFMKLVTENGFDGELSAENYADMEGDFDYCTDMFVAAIENGCKVINCPDTRGCAVEKADGELYYVKLMNKHVEAIKARIGEAEYEARGVIWSTHNHNDLGNAVINSLNSVLDGPCLQVEGCINGVGERAGNTALEQVVMNLEAIKRKKVEAWHRGRSGEEAEPAEKMVVHTHGLNLKHLKGASDIIAENMLPRQPNWPITGDNSARHTSGGHTRAVMEHPLAYQPFNPKAVGNEVSMVFGPNSGGNLARSIIEKQGYICVNRANDPDPVAHYDDIGDDHAKISLYLKQMFFDRRKGVTDAELVQGYKTLRYPIKGDVVYRDDKVVLCGRASEDGMARFFDQKGEEIVISSKFTTTGGKVSGPIGVDELIAATRSYIPGLEVVLDLGGPTLVRTQSTISREMLDKVTIVGEGADAMAQSTVTVTAPEYGQQAGTATSENTATVNIQAFIAAVNELYCEKVYRRSGDSSLAIEL